MPRLDVGLCVGLGVGTVGKLVGLGVGMVGLLDGISVGVVLGLPVGMLGEVVGPAVGQYLLVPGPHGEQSSTLAAPGSARKVPGGQKLTQLSSDLHAHSRCRWECFPLQVVLLRSLQKKHCPGTP